jgi:pilus assembly protein CpaE
MAAVNPIRVLVICDTGPVQEQVTAALGNQPDFQLVDLLTISDRLIREVRAAEPDLIVVDHMVGGQSTLDLIDELSSTFTESSVIAILPGEDSLRAQQVMLAGARAFLVQPFTQVNLISTLRRVRDLDVRRLVTYHPQSAMEERQRPLRIITVFSPRGGVGVSTVAANLALGFQEETDKRILLFEGKLYFGHLDVMLNIRSQNTLADLVPHANNMDDSLVFDVITRHASGVHVMLSPGNIQVAQGIRPDDLYNVFMGVQRLYDIVIVDAGNSLNENSVTLMDAADRVLLVATPDLAALRDASRFIQISKGLGYPTEKMLVLLNRAGMLGGVRPQDIETVLHNQIFAHVADDNANAVRSINRGIPLLYRYPRSPASKSYKKIVKQLNEMSVTEVTTSSYGTPSQSQREALMASSNLG